MSVCTTGHPLKKQLRSAEATAQEQATGHGGKEEGREVVAAVVGWHGQHPSSSCHPQPNQSLCTGIVFLDPAHSL